MNIASLSGIPLALFNEFSSPDTPGASQTFGHVGGSSVIRTNWSKVAGPNGPHTLVFEDYTCAHGCMHHKKLAVFNFPIEPAEFASGENLLGPRLTVQFSADDPPYSGSVLGRRFELGKGYWVTEHLTVEYGGFDHNASVISNFGDWEFAFLLQIQQRCHEIAKQVASRGHWQCEWNPTENYSKEPVLR